MEGLGFGLRAEASLRTLTEEVIKSSEIEGEILNRDQVRSSIARHLGMDIGAFTSADPQCRRRRRDDPRCDGKVRQPLTAERLFGWHAALFPTGRNGMTKIEVGA
jgi:Fic family protein